MDDFTPILLFLCAFAIIWTISTYNKFIKYRNMIEEGWSIIDVALKRRANLVPKLVSAVQGYMEHEASVLADIAGQRTRAYAGRAEVTAQESRVSESISQLLGVAESNPELRASGNFLDLQDALNEVELEIARSRNTFNQRIRFMNTLVEQFPSNIIARVFNFQRDSYFQLQLATEREMPSMPWDR